MSTEEKEPEEKAGWIKTLITLDGINTIVVALVAGMFALLGTTATSLSELRTERMKYEYDLISQILTVEKLDKEIDQKVASKRLQFLVKIEVIKSLNARAIKEIAESESLPSLPAPQTTGRVNSSSSFSGLSEIPAYVGTCRQIIPASGSIEIYSSTELGANPASRIGTIDAGTDIILTGVVREVPGSPIAAQIYLLDRRFPKQQPVGWADASLITDAIPCK